MKTLNKTRENPWSKAGRWIQTHPYPIIYITLLTAVFGWAIFLIIVSITAPGLPHYSGV